MSQNMPGLTEQTCADITNKIALLLECHAREQGATDLLGQLKDSALAISVHYTFLGPRFCSAAYPRLGTVQTYLSMADCLVGLVVVTSRSDKTAWQITEDGNTIRRVSGSLVDRMAPDGISTKDLLRLDGKELTDRIRLATAKEYVAERESESEKVRVKMVEQERTAWAKRIQNEICQLIRQSVPSKLFDEQAAISYAESWVTEQLAKPICPLEDLRETQLLGLVQGYKKFYSRDDW